MATNNNSPPTSTTVEAFFQNGVKYLGDDYYTASNTVCNICKDEVADPPQTALSTISNTTSKKSVVEVKSCGHIFHEICLQIWLKFKPHNNTNAHGTCPNCRQILVLNPQVIHEAQEQQGTTLAEMEDIQQQLEEVEAVANTLSARIRQAREDVDALLGQFGR